MKNTHRPKEGRNEKLVGKPPQAAARHTRMQQQMSYGALAILAIVVVSFVAWPILSNSTAGGRNVRFGSYRGQPIYYSAEYGLFNSNLNSQLNQSGFDSNDLQRRSLFERAFFSTVSQYGRYFLLQDQGAEVSDQESSALLYRQFERDGKLDRAAWSQLQTDPNRLKNAEEIMTYAAAQDIWSDMYQSLDLVSDAQLQLLVPTLGDMRKVSYLYYTLSDYPTTEVEEFYQQNPKLFQKKFLRRIVLSSKANLQKIQVQLDEDGSLFGQLAQRYSTDAYSQDKGDLGNQFYYEIRDFLRTAAAAPAASSDAADEAGSQAEQWADEIYALKEAQYAGPYQLGEQWYFFQIKSQAEIEAEQQAAAEQAKQNSKDTGEDGSKDNGEADSKTAQTDQPPPQTGFAAVASTVRSYIEQNEVSRITDYLRKNLEILKARAASSEATGLDTLENKGLEVAPAYDRTTKFFGFSYSGQSSSSLYSPLTDAFSQQGLGSSIAQSKDFFTGVFALQSGELSQVMLLGADTAPSSERYVIFFRLEESRQSRASDFARSGEGLESQKSLFNYYLNNMLVSGTELSFLSNKNLKQRFDTAYSSWSANSVQN